MTTQTMLPTRRRFTVEEFRQMGAAGIFAPEDRVELIDGEVIQMPPIGNPHAGEVNRMTMLFAQRFGDAAIVAVQNPVRLDDHDLPQPDFALLRPRPDFYATASPTPAGVFLIVEVADSTVRYDRQVKGPLYARAGILEYWLLDVNAATLNVYRDPSPEGYRSHQTLRRGERIALLAFPDREIALTDLLGEG